MQDRIKSRLLFSLQLGSLVKHLVLNGIFAYVLLHVLNTRSNAVSCTVVSQVSSAYWVSIFGIIFPRRISWCFSKLNFTLFSGHVRNLLRFLCIISDLTTIQCSVFNILRRCCLYAILVIQIIKEVINVWTKLILTSHWHCFSVGYLENFLFLLPDFSAVLSFSVSPVPPELESISNIGL